MRTILTALVLAALPGMAAADCACSCVNGQSVPICTLASDIAPICQRLCPRVLTQQITNPIVVMPIPSGNLITPTVPTTSPTDPTAAAAAAAGLVAPGTGAQLGAGSLTSTGTGVNLGTVTSGGGASVSGYR